MSKTTVYVGGIDASISSELLHAAFLPFGDIVRVDMPQQQQLRSAQSSAKGFAFIEFEHADDAASAIDNMHQSEVGGRLLKVNYARAGTGSGMQSVDGSMRPLWEQESYIQEHIVASGSTAGASASVDVPVAAKDLVDEGSRKKGNDLPRVYLDISLDGAGIGRVIIELRSDVVPKTAENFRQLCTHQRGFGYKQSPVHRIVPEFMLQAGDFTKGNGTGGKSIYGDKFADENFELKHEAAGCLSMANSGPHSNGSQFFITTTRTEWLDGKHVVFGRVISGMDVVRRVEAVGSASGKPSRKVMISASGQL
eukprot:Partr_v1_DN27277_c0_g2_i2_m38619 putative PPIases accelerate the folding of proteins. It catalyzes the cis-trans isomerization of proline imidic peptide bonds in oligopeptides (By similarity)